MDKGAMKEPVTSPASAARPPAADRLRVVSQYHRGRAGPLQAASRRGAAAHHVDLSGCRTGGAPVASSWPFGPGMLPGSTPSRSAIRCRVSGVKPSGVTLRAGGPAPAGSSRRASASSAASLLCSLTRRPAGVCAISAIAAACSGVRSAVSATTRRPPVTLTTAAASWSTSAGRKPIRTAPRLTCATSSAAVLRQLRDRLTVQRSGLRPDGTAPVLGGINGQSIARRLTAAASGAGIEGRITGHSGRVGLAVELTRRGAPEQATAKAGGWKSSRIWLPATRRP